MEENFDIDKHIDKIKSQIEQEPEVSNISDVPEDVLAGIPNLEPSLDGYAGVEEETVAPEVAQESENSKELVQEAVQELENPEELAQEAQSDSQPEAPMQEELPSAQESEWHDPFGTNDNDAVKKYVIYIAKDFVPFVDDMDKDARSAFVNESIQLKLQMEGKDRKWHAFARVLRHIIVSVFTLLVAVPALFWLADKSITATVQNYQYVQQNFEKLYKDKAERDKAAREIQQMRLGL